MDIRKKKNATCYPILFYSLKFLFKFEKLLWKKLRRDLICFNINYHFAVKNKGPVFVKKLPDFSYGCLYVCLSDHSISFKNKTNILNMIDYLCPRDMLSVLQQFSHIKGNITLVMHKRTADLVLRFPDRTSVCTDVGPLGTKSVGYK